jgi:hypothetical protein
MGAGATCPLTCATHKLIAPPASLRLSAAETHFGQLSSAVLEAVWVVLEVLV